MSVNYHYIENFILECSPDFRIYDTDSKVKLVEVLDSLDYDNLCFFNAAKFAKNPIAFYSKDEVEFVSLFLKSKSIPRALRGGNFEISCTAAEKKSYQKWARGCGFPTLSAFVNAAIRSFVNIDISAVELVRAQLEEAYKSKIYCISEINQIGNNLNQISRNVNVAHYNGEAANWAEIHEELIKIYMMMHLLFAEIRAFEIGGAMIVTRYVPRGGVGYIIGSIDINGIPRPSKILRGDLNAVLNALAFADKKKHRNPFLVTTYRDPTSLKELGGMKFLEKLMDDIEEVRFPRLKKNQFAYFFALHENVDGSTELNLFVVNVANERQFSSYVDSRDFASDRIFSEVIHEKYPKLVNPNAIENRRILAPNPRWDEHQLALFSEVKECAIDLCGDKNFVKNYSKSLLKTSLQAKGFTIEENANSSLFAKNDNAKIKLEGALLKKNPNLEELLDGTETPRKNKLSAAERLEISNDKRSEILLKKYQN